MAESGPELDELFTQPIADRANLRAAAPAGLPVAEVDKRRPETKRSNGIADEDIFMTESERNKMRGDKGKAPTNLPFE